ncbi:MAG: menaquinone biosynthesis protein [Pirellulales bacterium]|nr:menaquinone biosynthesis protein [Pirellulales bacterium]
MSGPEDARQKCPLRIGVVSYLNSEPLSVGLDRLEPEVELVDDVPSRLADRLAEGSLDAALVPSILLFGPGGFEIVSDACVSCDGSVRSVKLYSRTTVDRIENIALDEGSRTSAALVKIMLAERLGLRPRFEPLPIGTPPEACNADAVMLIGDRAMLDPPGPFVHVWDLGQEWKAWTGLPFVFALWLARPGVPKDRLAKLLAGARDEGLRRLEEVAQKEGPLRGLTAEECLDYFRRNLAFHLGPRQREGLTRFGELVRKHGLVPAEDAASHPGRPQPQTKLQSMAKRVEKRLVDGRLQT